MRPGIDPKVDYAFKRLFGREPNLPLLRHFLNAVLKLPPPAQIAELQLLNPFSVQDALDDKLSIVDVKARDLSGRLFHVEMQILPERAFCGRVLYYWAGLHQQQLHAGDAYHLLRPTISICLTDFVLFPEVADYCLVFELLNRANQLVFSPDLLLVALELPKFGRAADELADPLDVWMYFFRHAEELDSDTLPAALNTPEIHHALEELNVLSQNDQERERYLARVKMQRDQLSRLASAREEGRLMGLIQAYQEMLHQPVTPSEQLRDVPLEQLHELAQQLKGQLVR
jgi:predicted transposase/invertase (TIGR01784 family)